MSREHYAFRVAGEEPLVDRISLASGDYIKPQFPKRGEKTLLRYLPFHLRSVIAVTEQLHSTGNTIASGLGGQEFV